MPEVTPEQFDALSSSIDTLVTEVQSLNESYQNKKAEIDASTADNEDRTSDAIENMIGSGLLPHNSIQNSYFTEYEEVNGIKIPLGGLLPMANSRSQVELVSPYIFGFASLSSHDSDHNWKDNNPDKVVEDPALADGVNKILVGIGASEPGIYTLSTASVLSGASYPLPNSTYVNRWAHLHNSSKYMHVAKVTAPAYEEGMSLHNWVGFDDDPTWFKAEKILFRCYVYVVSGVVRFGSQKGYNLDTTPGLLELSSVDFGSNGWQFVELVFHTGTNKPRSNSLYRSLTIGAGHDQDAEFYIAMPYAAPLRDGESISGIGISPNADYL